MKVITVKPATSEDENIIVEFDGQNVYISSDLSPIVCSPSQAHLLGEFLQNPERIPDLDQ
jgi:hypothetical protein